MNKFYISDWLNSEGGPLIVMPELNAHQWKGVLNGFPSDYDLACQSPDYASKLVSYNSNILVLGDEPLQTSFAIVNNHRLIIRWKWADKESVVINAIQQIDFNVLVAVEKLILDWENVSLVMFDSANQFNPMQCLRFHMSKCKLISTYNYQPDARLSLLVHVFHDDVKYGTSEAKDIAH